jgi:chorismate dehydratase
MYAVVSRILKSLFPQRASGLRGAGRIILLNPAGRHSLGCVQSRGQEHALIHRLGVVSFLNSKPLIDGLADRNDVELCFDVPSRLQEALDRGRVDVALVPIVDVLRSEGRLRVVSDACIACDGETMTVRVFSQVPPDRIHTLWVDGDSHTSIALATVMWHELYDRKLELKPFDPHKQSPESCESVLLIGDKVVNKPRGGSAYEVDLGAAWKSHTGLPFVFAVWAAKSTEYRVASSESEDGPDDSSLATRYSQLATLLSSARDRGVARAREIATEYAPKLWWPTDLAVKYLTRCLNYKLDARFIEGANLFAQLCIRAGVAPGESEILWPDALIQSASA